MQAQPSRALLEASARRFFCHLLAALRHAHSRGYLHCDVKPANVRLNGVCDRAVLVDWGMARNLHRQTGLGLTCGTPLYASPEQLTGHNPEDAWGRSGLSAAADVWSLGAALHEMTLGTVPFDGASFEELRANVMALRFSEAAAVGAAAAETGVAVSAAGFSRPTAAGAALQCDACEPSPPPSPLAARRAAAGGAAGAASAAGGAPGLGADASAASQPLMSADVPRLIRSMLQLLPSERPSISELCTDPWVLCDGHLPPPIALPRAIVSGKGFEERTDVDGLPRGGGGSGGGGGGGGSRAGARLRRRLALLLGFDPKQWGATPLAKTLGVKPGLTAQSFPIIEGLAERHRSAILGVGYALALGCALGGWTLSEGWIGDEGSSPVSASRLGGFSLVEEDGLA